MVEPTFTIELRSPLTGSQEPVAFEIDPDTVQLSFSNSIDGGDQAMNVGLPDPRRPEFGYLPRPIESLPWADVTLRAGTHKLFRGRLVEPILSPGGMVGFIAEGYGPGALSDVPFQSKDTVTREPAGLVRQVLYTTTRAVTAAPGFGITSTSVDHAPHEFDLMYPGQILDRLTGEGGSGLQWDAYVEDRGAGPSLYFLPRVPNPEPTYIVPFDSRVAPVHEDYRVVYGTLIMTYADTADNTTKRFTMSTPGFGIQYPNLQRTAVVKGGKMTATQARGFARTWLVAHSIPARRTQVSRDLMRGVEWNQVGDVPAYVPRSGETMRVATFPTMYIVRMQYDANQRRGSYELGEPAPTTVARLQQLIADRNRARAGINLATKAPDSDVAA